MKKAFTLIELLIVVAILGFLLAFIGPAIINQFGKAKQDITCTQMGGISQTLDMFKLDNGVYPSTDEGLEALISNPDADKYPNYASFPYFQKGKMPKDSWKRKFEYISTGSSFDIISLGADGKEGGDGESADIYLSKCQ
ncbi:MAG: type II secretion system major pseudopilin GspG [Sulfurovum sp.]|nr:type II secretion system major pseudopilin GspG [Sulfurovum sp.]